MVLEQIVSANPIAPLRLVHDFILRRLGSEAEQIEEDNKAIKQFREETEKNREKILKCVGAPLSGSDGQYVQLVSLWTVIVHLNNCCTIKTWCSFLLLVPYPCCQRPV